MNTHQEILYDCKKATLLIEKKLGSSLSVREAIELKLHLTSCSVCRLYQSQTTLIGAMVKQILIKQKAHGLDKQLKNELQKQINFHQGKRDKKNGS